MLKSALRVVGFAFLLLWPFVAIIVLIVAELLGIIEERV
jgi:hypothetical protein